MHPSHSPLLCLTCVNMIVSTVNVNDADNANNDGGVDDVNDVNYEEDADETCAEHVGGDADTARAHC